MFLKNNSAGKPSGSKKETALSVVAKDTHVLGNIVGEGAIDFDGTLDGNIRCHTLTIRANGNVKGDVNADTVFVHGRLNGVIRAKTVHLHTGCHVEGIVMHEILTMEDGAFLDGKCKRTDKISTSDDEISAPMAFEDRPITDKLPLDGIRLIRS